MEHAQPTAGQDMPDPTLAAPSSAPDPASPPLPLDYSNRDLPLAKPPAREPRWSPIVRWLLGAQIILLLALAQVMWAGYRLGVGNQTIQIPFLKRSIDSQLYKGDAMVEQTLPYYSSYFYKGVAKIVSWVEPMARPDAQGRIPFDPVTSVYFWLHVLTAAAVLAAAYALGRAMFKNRWAGIFLMLFLLAGHHVALAGDALYSIGFTHTWAVFPLAIAAIALLYADRYFLAFALAGLIFNLHALTAAYLFVMFGAWAAIEFRHRRDWWRLILMAGIFGFLAIPTVMDMVRQRQVFGAQWLELTRVRSADHSFPRTWWTDGGSDVPRFLLIAGLAAVAFSFTTDARTRRKSIGIALGATLLFLLGTILTEIWPVPTVIRAQLFRASRLLMVVMLGHVAYGVVSGIGLLRRNRDDERLATTARQFSRSADGARPVPSHILEPLIAIAVFLCIAVPGMIAWAPWVLAVALIAALWSGRLSWAQSALAGLALLVTLLAWGTINYHVPGLPKSDAPQEIRETIRPLVVLNEAWKDLRAAAQTGGWALALSTGLAILGWGWMRIRRIGPRVKLCTAAAVACVCAVLALHTYRQNVWNGGLQTDPWVQAQFWASRNSPKDALFLTPPQQGGWRIYSERPVVFEWRDGTQLYFAADFAADWGRKLHKLRPVVLDTRGKEIARGQSLEEMSEDKLIKLCRELGAQFVVLPAGKSRNLRPVYENEKWAIYEAKIDVPEGANPVAWREQEAFIEEVAKPNIEKYRKGDATVEITDEAGKPITSGAYQIRLTNHAFNFGCSLPPFLDLTNMYAPEWTAPPVRPRQLERMKEVFNYSMIPYSGKWNFIEPREGQRNYEDLDRYVDWCTKNNIRMEFHYLSGFMPSWLRGRSTSQQIAAWKRHCMDLVDRYGDRIKVWQVVNDSYLIDYAADVFKEIKQKHPDLKLGISHCSMFYGEYGSDREMFRGSEDIETLKAQGVTPDFYATHGHKPNGLWPSGKSMYKLFDGFAEYGCRVHISEATLDIGLNIVGPLREGPWTPELAADFWEQFYTVAFSHPAVDAVNYWDLAYSQIRSSAAGRGTGAAGLLDPSRGDEPRPAFNRIKHLIKDVWTTNVNGALSSDAKVAFRGFYGDYEVVVTQPSGKVLKGKFVITKGAQNRIKVQVNADNGASVVSGANVPP
jgi:GH35 family endo-1,4-beta-xylanase